MEIVVNPVEVELAAMRAWADKLSNKMIAFHEEQDRDKKDRMADELVDMIEKHIKVVRESELIKSFGPEARSIVEEGLERLDDMVVILRAQQKILKIMRGMD